MAQTVRLDMWLQTGPSGPAPGTAAEGRAGLVPPRLPPTQLWAGRPVPHPPALPAWALRPGRHRNSRDVM